MVKKAPDIKAKLKQILKTGPYLHVKPGRIFCFRSHGSTARARARIWAFPRIWQLALKIEPAYVIEVLAEKFDHLSDKDKTRVLIHELAHVPKNFSGSLLPHWRRLFKNL
ncbi:hypothetical protein A3I57_03070 [Candidatus Beckwithbacteria bacterium RIFCSPLOWO2_02_FULL_47_23]|uniref:Putative phage metallopeptidase domain-containing protein n=2 Tax=Candidatus Beckwithiibacteriota TaxID=1752726 RepID=A0A1F5E230_9BACT|nr:MAG: hypothetical protein A3E73_01635 [Candidatus Beckwithbacteria bacterium RIFCSPHIGHO2_12_FULL_47_17]OGD61467.1 MAG: hypothetical protein A3I57_03070 [Candidatus Beckwithbacteria bacterium RIFCSPLOWO2_02_FULL_47_23]